METSPVESSALFRGTAFRGSSALRSMAMAVCCLSPAFAAEPAPDLPVAFCRPVEAAACICSMQHVETALSASEQAWLLLALLRAGAIDVREHAQFAAQRAAACTANTGQPQGVNEQLVDHAPANVAAR